MADILLSAEY